MTRYYLYIECGVQLDINTRFFRVAIGQSKIGIRQKAWLESYAIEHGHFMALWTIDAVNFLDKCKESIYYPTSEVKVLTASLLIKHLRTGDEVPATFMANLNRHRMMMQLDPGYYAEHCIYRCNLKTSGQKYKP